MKKLAFNINGFGLCHGCQTGALFVEDVPDNWDEMTEDEKHEFAQEVWHGLVQWGWAEVNEGQ